MFQKSKTCELNCNNFFFANKKYEISNLDLVRDMDIIVGPEDIL